MTHFAAFGVYYSWAPLSLFVIISVLWVFYGSGTAIGPSDANDESSPEEFTGYSGWPAFGSICSLEFLGAYLAELFFGIALGYGSYAIVDLVL